LAQAFVAENIGLQRHAVKELQKIAKTHPKSAMEGFGVALMDSERGWRLLVSNARELISSLPSEIVLAWVRGHGLEGAQAIARHLPLPHLDDVGTPIVPPVLDAILFEYNDDTVFENFLTGSRSSDSWWGNGADQFRKNANCAKRFLKHPNRRICEWAKTEVDYRLHLAEWEEQRHEEWLLPS
jgi:hypothetical protein